MRITTLIFSALISFSAITFDISTSHAASRTYLVNGIASAVPFIGYGMRHLKKKIRGAKLFSYITSGEGNAVQRNIIKDVIARFAADPKLSVNLIGISYGANVVTKVASILATKNIPVNYLGIIDGTSLASIKANVRKADNFVCTGGDCAGTNARMAAGNTRTVFKKFTIKSAHIALGDNKQVHNRVIAQIR